MVSTSSTTRYAKAAGRVAVQAARRLGQRDAELVLDVEHRVVPGAVGDADPQVREAAGRAHVGEAHLLRARHRHDRPPGGLAEQRDERVQLVGQPDPGADAVAQARLDQRLGEAAVGEVVRGVDQAVARGVDQDVGELLLGGQVDPRRQAAEVAVHDVGPLRAGELLAGRAEQVDLLALRDEAGRRTPGDVVDHAEHRHHRGRQDRRLAGLVVEADVAAGDQDAERLGSRRRAHGWPRRTATSPPGPRASRS